jgi:hypothetical protein
MKISRSMFTIVALAVAVVACRPLSGFAQHGHLPTGSLALRGSTTVPLVLSGNHVLIEAQVGKSSYAFLFDSGGTAILTPRVQRAAQFVEIGHAHVVGTEAVARRRLTAAQRRETFLKERDRRGPRPPLSADALEVIDPSTCS